MTSAKVTTASARTAQLKAVNRSRASSGSEVMLSSLRGHKDRQLEMEPPAPSCGSKSWIAVEKTSTMTAPAASTTFEARSNRPVGNARIRTYVASPKTFSQKSPSVNSQLSLDDCRM